MTLEVTLKLVVMVYYFKVVQLHQEYWLILKMEIQEKYQVVMLNLHKEKYYLNFHIYQKKK